MTTNLQIENLVLGYEGAAFTAPINLDLNPGEIVAILGPSGCGKSTLLNTIVGGVAPISGEIRIADQSVLTIPTHRRGVGIMYQQSLLFPHLNVFQNVAFGLRPLKMPKTEVTQKVDSLLELVRMQDFASRDVAELSGGEAQRINLIRALAPTPKILLLDEPLSALDADLRSELGNELHRILKTAAITTLFVTHDRTEAEMISDRVVQWSWS